MYNYITKILKVNMISKFNLKITIYDKETIEPVFWHSFTSPVFKIYNPLADSPVRFAELTHFRQCATIGINNAT